MPLYEFIVVAKAGPAKATADMLQDVVKGILTTYPSAQVRDIQNLGDRILGNSKRLNKLNHKVARYLQIMVDAPPAVNLTVRSILNTKYEREVFMSHMHKVKDLDYALNTYFRAQRAIDPFNDTKDYEYAQKVMQMKEKVDKLDNPF